MIRPISRSRHSTRPQSHTTQIAIGLEGGDHVLVEAEEEIVGEVNGEKRHRHDGEEGKESVVAHGGSLWKGTRPIVTQYGKDCQLHVAQYHRAKIAVDARDDQS
jgi:hypothetical protein